jgi:hypothetical protein
MEFTSVRYDTKNGNRLCACGHTKDQHFNGRGLCAVQVDREVRCDCICFRNFKPITADLETLKQYERRTCVRLDKVTRELDNARKLVKRLEGAYRRANEAHAEARARYVIVHTS